MKEIKDIDSLPRPLRVLARSFLSMDTNPPEIFEAVPDEMSALRTEQEVVFQLVLDKQWMNWYLVAVGDQERRKQSDYILHDPITVKKAILVFSLVDDSWLRNKRHEYDKHAIDSENRARVWDGQKFSLEPVGVEFDEPIDAEEIWE